MGNVACARPSELPFPLIVTLTRISPGVLDDDGVPSSCKSVRDGIADWLGINDRHRHIVEYRYQQERGKRGEYGVRVEVKTRSEG